MRPARLVPVVLALVAALAPPLALAETSVMVEPHVVTDWKAVYGRIEAQSRIPARARIGGTLVSLDVTEGDTVEAGAEIARVFDQKLDFQRGAIDAQLRALASQLANAETELARGEELLQRGVTTAQRLDTLRTQTEVLRNQIAATESERQVIDQQAAEGRVLAPIAGRVLTVPATTGAVVLPGEPIATIGGGGFFLRLAVPERHATMLEEDAAITIEAPAGPVEGRLARIYPQIENGRVIADVEVEALDDAFVDARLPVRLPIGTREALLVPEAAVSRRFGLDFVEVVDTAGGARSVVLGQRHDIDGTAMVEILSGFAAGETVRVP
jgi:RND family efflux transporter MFP subunit